MANTSTMSVGTAAQIHGEIARVVQDILRRHPDGKHNAGRSILEAFIWDEIVKVAKGRSDQVWERMQQAGVYIPPDMKPGKYECGDSPRFLIKASVSEPVRRFSEEELMKVMEASQFHVPPHMTKGFVAAAKVAGANQVRLSIVER